MNKKTVVISLMITMLMFFLSLVSCGPETTGIVAQNAVIKSYVGSYIKNVPNEAISTVLIEKKDSLITKALYNFLKEPELQDLDPNDRVKQSVLLAVEQIINQTD